MRKVLVTIPLGLAAFTFFSCGGGGGSDSSTSTTLTGQFVDAPVAGLDYETSSGITGTTNSNGYFNYREGDIITFKIGGLLLGDAKGNSIITPTALFVDNAGLEDAQTKAISLSALLLALDENPNDDVITIPETVKEALKDTSIAFESTDQLDISLDIDGDGTEENLGQLIEEYKDNATQHYTNTLYSLVEQALINMKANKIYFYNFTQGYASCDSCELDYADGQVNLYNCTNNMNGIHSIYIGDGVYWEQPDGTNLLIVSADPNYPKVCVIDKNQEEWCIQKGEPPADCKADSEEYPTQDLRDLVYGKIINGELTSDTKIRIVPDANWQEGNYNGIVCSVNLSNGEFGPACKLYTDRNLFETSQQCQIVVFEDLNDSWRFEKEEEYTVKFGADISCSIISNFIIDIGNNSAYPADSGIQTGAVSITDFENFVTAANNKNIYLLAGEFQIRQLSADTTNKLIRFSEFTFDNYTEPAFTLTYWEENGTVYVRDINGSPDVKNPATFKYEDKILCIEEYGVVSDTSYIHSCIVNPSQTPIVEQGASTVENTIEGTWIEYRLSGEQGLCLRFENGTVYFYEYSTGQSGSTSYSTQSVTINGRTITAVVINTGEEDINIFPLFYDGNSIYYYIMWFDANTENLKDAALRKLVPTSTCP
ncbi:hypothetical protein [Persephonella sp.]